MSDTTITSLFETTARPLLSYEFFPPKSEAGMEGLRTTVANLKGTDPDFVTVTYGAGGSTQNKTFEVCELLREHGFGPVMPHLTCVGSTRGRLEEIADEMHGRDFRNIMTLRGDPPRGETEFVKPEDGLDNARDLVALLQGRHADFCCGVAGYPECHPEAQSADIEMAYLKEKVDAGASFITTQLFFDNALYFDFVQRARDAGIEVPIVPGLLPAVSIAQAERFTGMCGSTFPQELAARMRDAGEQPDAVEDVGIQWCVEQIAGLLKQGVPGIHLYILNRSRAALSPDLAQVFKNLTG